MVSCQRILLLLIFVLVVADAASKNRANKKAIAYDIAYSQEMTPFLFQAGLAGLKVVDGLEMLVAQGARSFEWWFGTAAPIDAMRQAVR